MRASHTCVFWFACGLLVLWVAGCSNQTVTEDRSINYSRGGGDVGFQHGDEGVFIASGKGEQLEKIFESDEDTIAVSSPLWSPVDDRLIFMAARRANPDNTGIAHDIAAWDANPAGRSFQPEAIRYTCMLRTPSSDGSRASSNVLFDAACDHTGYVAANLAVRWHPSGDRILFIDQTSEGQHSLFEYDLRTQEIRRVLDKSAAAIIFDWTPNGSHLVCVLASGVGNPKIDGIWIRSADESSWWKVPFSENLATSESDALLERLRSTRPAWTEDEQRFAFAGHSVRQSAEDVAEETSLIIVGDAASRELRKVYEGSGRISDLHWRPNSDEIGFVEEASSPSLKILDENGSVLAAMDAAPVRRFAGWSFDGIQLAYITPEPAAADGTHWALLFPRVADARDHVYVADGAGDLPGRIVHQGVRITFPQWSPSDESLSLWGTYTPTHRSLLSTILPWTLRPGDPAAILNCRTGQMEWMAVNAHEEAQVGHYYLLHRDYNQAWHWYAKSIQHRDAAEPIKLSEFDQFLRQIRIHQDSAFFEYYCLSKLGRHAEAEQRLRQFRSSMSLDTRDADELFQRWGLASEQLQSELGRLSKFVTPLIQYAYITEVYLSLDACEDGIAFLRQELNNATTEFERLACALCLSQMLLMQDDHSAYVELVLETLMPLMMSMHHAGAFLDFGQASDLPTFMTQIEQGTLLGSGGLAILPMMSSSFLHRFKDDQLHEYLYRWQALGVAAKDDMESLAIDLVQFAILTRLGEDEESAAVDQRIRNNSQLHQALPIEDPRDIDLFIEKLGEMLQ